MTLEEKNAVAELQSKHGWFVQMLIDVRDFFLRVFHLYTKKQHDQICVVTRTLYEAQIVQLRENLAHASGDKISLEEELAALKQEVERLRHENLDFRREHDSYERQIMDMKIKTARYRVAASENLDLVKDIEKQLGDVMNTDHWFGFNGSHAIPGATSFHTEGVDVEEVGSFTVLRSRTLALDDVTQIVNSTPDMYGRINAILDQMRRYGTLASIAERLISCGAVQFVLAYDRGSTTYSLYIETVAKNYNPESLMVIEQIPKNINDDETEKKVEG